MVIRSALALAALITALPVVFARADGDTPPRLRLYDGDTAAPTMRLTIDGRTSFDTPEVARWLGAKCELEIARGKAATARLRDMLATARRVEMFPFLDDDGALALIDDGRGLMRVMTDGVNVGIRLAAEGHAMIYDHRAERIDWCAEKPVRMPK